jgi:DNA polymerase-3 subunit epsilon
MKMSTNIADSESLARQLESDPEYRVLRAVPEPHFDLPPGPAPAGTCIAIVDCETTGLDATRHEMIELAILLIWANDEGEVIAHQKPRSWLQQPTSKLDPAIVLLTGLTDAGLKGKAIDDQLASSLLDRADLVVAHNARFDRAWIDRRYREHANKAWACSCHEVDWPELGFEGRNQQHLLMQHGWFANAHRAGDDAWSLLHLLRQERREPSSGKVRSHLARLIERADMPTELVEAVGSPIARKDELKNRGYRWNAKDRVWFTELDPADLPAERAWFSLNGFPPFRSQTITACERHR